MMARLGRGPAVAAVSGVRNPISAARRVLEEDAALLVGAPATGFAAQAGLFER